MIYKVKGTYSRGLKIYHQNELKYYSTLKNSWFSGCLISIFDNSDKLILKIRETGFFGSKYNLKFQDKEVLNKQFVLTDKLPAKSELTFKNNDKLILNRKWIQLANPVSNILFNEKEIGKVKMKLLSLERNYEIEVFQTDTIADIYTLILFLCTESNSDPDYH